jgi:hypothetical protein
MYNAPMISIDLPEQTFHRMQLIDRRKEKGRAVSIGDATSWIELADPQHIRLSNNAINDDKELEQFLAADDRAYRYDYVRLGCTFCPRNGERFEKAWLSVSLKTETGQTAVAPISWSLFPLNEYDSVEESVSTKIGSTGKIVNAEVGASSKLTKRLYSLRGFREGQPDPYWELSHNEVSDLNGSIRFHLIVRSGAGNPTLGQVQLEAVIGKRSFLAFRVKRPFDQTPAAEFRLPPVLP